MIPIQSSPTPNGDAMMRYRGEELEGRDHPLCQPFIGDDRVEVATMLHTAAIHMTIPVGGGACQWFTWNATRGVGVAYKGTNEEFAHVLAMPQGPLYWTLRSWAAGRTSSAYTLRNLPSVTVRPVNTHADAGSQDLFMSSVPGCQHQPGALSDALERAGLMVRPYPCINPWVFWALKAYDPYPVVDQLFDWRAALSAFLTANPFHHRDALEATYSIGGMAALHALLRGR